MDIFDFIEYLEKQKANAELNKQKAMGVGDVEANQVFFGQIMLLNQMIGEFKLRSGRQREVSDFLMKQQSMQEINKKVVTNEEIMD